MKKLVLLIMVSLVLQSRAQSEATELKEVGKRGWHTTAGAVAAFDPDHESVDLWIPKFPKKHLLWCTLMVEPVSVKMIAHESHCYGATALLRFHSMPMK